MAHEPVLSETDILDAVIAPSTGSLPPDCARAILELRFDESAVQRMNHLAEQNRLGAISGAELAELNKYMRVGSFLNLMQAKARLSLHRHDSAA